MVRFREETLDYELVIHGAAAPLFAEILDLKSHFGSKAFSPKDLYQNVGMSRATAHRMVTRLLLAGAVRKQGHGRYVLTKEIRERVWTGCNI